MPTTAGLTCVEAVAEPRGSGTLVQPTHLLCKALLQLFCFENVEATQILVRYLLAPGRHPCGATFIHLISAPSAPTFIKLSSRDASQRCCTPCRPRFRPN
ncbi:unnamed protein product [Ectocarpus sp. 6 AP-2014]